MQYEGCSLPEGVDVCGLLLLLLRGSARSRCRSGTFTISGRTKTLTTATAARAAKQRAWAELRAETSAGLALGTTGLQTKKIVTADLVAGVVWWGHAAVSRERASVTTTHGSTTVTTTVAAVTLTLSFFGSLCGLCLGVNLLDGLGTLVVIL
jgi:hypothetical protein